jgi:hypothetical protein
MNTFSFRAEPTCSIPSMHWPTSVLTIDADADADHGPALVTIECCIAPQNRDTLLVAIGHLGQQRRWDGAYAWVVFEEGLKKYASLKPSWSRPGLSISGNTIA